MEGLWSVGGCGGGEEGIGVDIAIVWSHVDAEVRRGCFGSKGPAGKVSEVSRELLYENTHCMHLAVALGPNHSPGCFPQASAPCSTNL